MSVFKNVSKVRSAQHEVHIARTQVAVASDAVIRRGRGHPLSAMGLFVGVGVVLGTFVGNPLRLPGATGLLGSSFGSMAALGLRLLTDFGMAGGFGGSGSDADA